MTATQRKPVGLLALLAFLAGQAMCALHIGHSHEAHLASHEPQCAHCEHSHPGHVGDSDKRPDDEDDEHDSRAPSPCTCVMCQLGLQVAVVDEWPTELPSIAEVPGERTISPCPALAPSFLSFHVFGPRSPPAEVLS